MVALRRVRAWLATGVVLRACLWAIAAASVGLLLIAAADMVAAIPLAGRRVLLGIVGCAACAVAAALLRRDRRALRLDAVALWVEERGPEPRFGLMSDLVSGGALRLVAPGASAVWPALARRRATRALAAPLAAVVVALALIALLPAGSRARVAAPRAGDSIERATLGGMQANRLANLAVEVAAPAYAHREPARFDDPSSVRALPGSRITVLGKGDGQGIVARLTRSAPAAVRAVTQGNRWRVELRAPDSAAVIELTDGPRHRILGVEPESDAAPTVSLHAPRRDSVLRAARGRITLAAAASDDLGLAEAHFEIVISSGEGETFAFRTLTLGAERLTAREAMITASLRLDSLQLKAGDVLHVRAVARDANAVAGPGVGASETRVLRIARPGADDSLAITPAAPPDTNASALSERMLIQLTEALARRRTSLDRQHLLGEAHSIAVDQQRLRRNVGDVVFARLGGQPSSEDEAAAQAPVRGDSMQTMLERADRATSQSIQTLDFEGGESPVVAVNKPLLEAYNAMWEAGGLLEQGELEQALPHMRAALAAIERSRRADRVYLRGRAPDIVVDVSKARLQGREHGSSSTRAPRPPADTAVRDLEARYARILSLPHAQSSQLADSLLILRVAALAAAPDFAASLGKAADAIRHGRAADATRALLAARRALAGSPLVLPSLAGWGLQP
jgi:hypothetical protein